MAVIPNGHYKRQIVEVGLKIVVIGEPKCGKTRFIRTYYDHHIPRDIISLNGVKVYTCELFDEEYSRVSLFEIPSDPEFFLEQRRPHYKNADIIVFMYAVDDPKSLQMLFEKWLVETIDIIDLKKLPVLFVGNKKDLEDDQEVIERLAIKNESPVTLAQAQETVETFSNSATIMECSAYEYDMVENIFNTIFSMIPDDETE